MESFWSLSIHVELSSLKFFFSHFQCIPQAPHLGMMSLVHLQIVTRRFLMTWREDQMIFQFTLVAANFLELFNAKYIVYKL